MNKWEFDSSYGHPLFFLWIKAYSHEKKLAPFCKLELTCKDKKNVLLIVIQKTFWTTVFTILEPLKSTIKSTLTVFVYKPFIHRNHIPLRGSPASLLVSWLDIKCMKRTAPKSWAIIISYILTTCRYLYL